MQKGDETRQRVKFTDERVCKSHLLNCCPHDILSGTRMDLGECTKIHDLALRADYEIASKERDLFFELDAVDHLESFIADCDRRTELAKKRLAETQEEISAEVAAKAEKVHELNEEIGKLLAKAEQLGAEGNVDEAQKVLQEVEKVRTRKKDAEEEYRNSMPASSFQQQKLRVCEVCSAYLGLHDNDRRLADHFGPDHGAESIEGPVLVTVEGGAHAPRHETGAAHAHAPGRGGGGIAAGPAPAAEATVTATSRAPDTSKQSSQFTAGSCSWSSRDRERSSRDRSRERERDRRDGVNGRSDSRRAEDRDMGDL
eukprot:superscaffoldBa00000091_g1359